MLASFLCVEFLLHILSWLLSSSFFISREFPSHTPCWLHFYVGRFSYTSRAGFIFYLGSLSYTSHAGFSLSLSLSLSLFLRWGVSLKHPMLALFFICGVSLTHPVLGSFLSGEFLIHISFCLQFYAKSFSYTFRAGFFLFSFLSGEFLLLIPCWFYLQFLLHISCWLNFCLESFSYTSRAGFIFIWGVTPTHPVLASFLSCWLHFYGGSFSYTSRAVLFHLFLSGEFLLHISCLFLFILFGVFLLRIPCWVFYFYFFIGGVSLTHLVLASFLSGEFLLHIPCWLHFSMGSFSYTSRAGFIFIWRVFLTHPMLYFFLFFIWGVCFTHLMDVLTIPTAYQKKKNFYLSSWIFFF